MRLVKQVSLENMALMKNKAIFFKDMVDIVEKTRVIVRNKKDRLTGLLDTSFYEDVKKSVKEHTGIWISKFSLGNPQIWIPEIGDNHIFTKNIVAKFKEHLGPNFNGSRMILQELQRLKTTSTSGSIDVKNGKVSGIFETIGIELMMPENMFSEFRYSSEEIAAIMLHEFGHAYTFFLYANRTIMTNQVLATLARTYEGTSTSEEQTVVFERYAIDNNMSTAYLAAMKKCKKPEELAVVILSKEVEDCQSELGYSLYDVNSCEALADEYATRCGAGGSVASALHKTFQDYGGSDNTIRWRRTVGFFAHWLGELAKAVALRTPLGVAFGIFSIVGGFLSCVFDPNKRDELYDNPFARLNRIKIHSVNLLKNEKTTPEEKKKLLVEIEQITEMLTDYSDGLKLESVAAYIFRPAYRKAHDFEMLQKELENLATNDLFASAAKLKMI